MPKIESPDISVALDMRGCPNRCRHCYYGRVRNGRLSEHDLRWAVSRFREYVRHGEDRPLVRNLNAVTWDREPDFGDDYRRLYELEVELSNTKTYRAEWELLSVWRLARDESYAPWAHGIGVRTAQISFFGVGETQDWFCRRKGAFRDCIAATERLLDAGIKPRWQLFLTTKILPELGELMGLVDRLRLREQCEELGGEFVMFIHTPGPDGEARFIEHLRPTVDEADAIPQELLESTRKHFGRERLWGTVGERVTEILAAESDAFPWGWRYQDPLFFIVQANWDVYSNMGSGDPWWKLGNLKVDPVADIIARFEQDLIPALKANAAISVADLARRYGDPKSQRVGRDAEYWLEKHCADAASDQLA